MRSIAATMKRILAIVLVLMTLSVSAFADTDALVFGSKMKVYFAPSTSSEQIGALPRGTEIKVEAISNGWARINYKGYIGFARVSEMVTLSPVKAKTKALTPILYITPDNMTPQRGTLDRNTTVYVRSMNGDMVMVSDRTMTILAIMPAANLSF